MNLAPLVLSVKSFVTLFGGACATSISAQTLKQCSISNSVIFFVKVAYFKRIGPETEVNKLMYSENSYYRLHRINDLVKNWLGYSVKRVFVRMFWSADCRVKYLLDHL